MLSLPPKGTSADDVLFAMKRARGHDAKWQEGKTWSLVYYAGDDVSDLLKNAYALFFSENGLNPMVFPSLKKFEAESTGL